MNHTNESIIQAAVKAAVSREDVYVMYKHDLSMLHDFLSIDNDEKRRIKMEDRYDRLAEIIRRADEIKIQRG